MDALIDRFAGPLGVGLLAALVAWVATEVARRWVVVTDWPSRRVRNAALRTLAVIVGAAAGAALGGALEDVGGWPWGTLAGVAGGGTCTLVIAWLRRRARGDAIAAMPEGHDDGRHAGGAP